MLGILKRKGHAKSIARPISKDEMEKYLIFKEAHPNANNDQIREHMGPDFDSEILYQDKTAYQIAFIEGNVHAMEILQCYFEMLYAKDKANPTKEEKHRGYCLMSAQLEEIGQLEDDGVRDDKILITSDGELEAIKNHLKNFSHDFSDEDLDRLDKEWFHEVGRAQRACLTQYKVLQIAAGINVMIEAIVDELHDRELPKLETYINDFIIPVSCFSGPAFHHSLSVSQWLTRVSGAGSRFSLANKRNRRITSLNKMIETTREAHRDLCCKAAPKYTASFRPT